MLETLLLTKFKLLEGRFDSLCMLFFSLMIFTCLLRKEPSNGINRFSFLVEVLFFESETFLRMATFKGEFGCVLKWLPPPVGSWAMMLSCLRNVDFFVSSSLVFESSIWEIKRDFRWEFLFPWMDFFEVIEDFLEILLELLLEEPASLVGFKTLKTMFLPEWILLDFPVPSFTNPPPFPLEFPLFEEKDSSLRRLRF